MQDNISDVSYIIGFREANTERKAALIFVLKKLRNYFPDLEILVVEQDNKPKLTLDKSLNVKKIFIRNDRLYNRCWAFNVGVNNTEKNIFVFADSDIFLEKKDYLECFQTVAEFEAVTPNMSEAINIRISNPATLDYEILHKRELFTFAGGILLLTKNGFGKIGGWDERFEGWGAEDEAISHVIFETLTSKSFSFPLYHIDHPRTELDGKQQEKYLENRNMAKEILSMSGPSIKNYIQRLKNIPHGIPEKYFNENKEKKIEGLKFILAITTYNRIDYLKTCINSFLRTKNKDIKWQLLIADDGSSDGTKEYLAELEATMNAKIIYNNRVDIHQQVNSILNYLSNIDFDLCFKCDDDVVFQKPGWDLLYMETIERTGYQHLVFFDNNWNPSVNLNRPITFGQLTSNCPPEKIQGAFYTLTMEVIKKIGFFDRQCFGRRGLGHVDFSFRCCRAGFNSIDHPFDVKNSNDYIRLQKSNNYSSSLSAKYKSLLNPKEVVEQKRKLIYKNRIYIPYNEKEDNLRYEELNAIKALQKNNKQTKQVMHKKADATFYPERGLGGFFGFLLKRFYNICIDLRLYFLPGLIKAFGRNLNKLSIDLINIED